MSEVFRAFIAIELEKDVKATLADLKDQLRQANVAGVRLTRPDAAHLTLKFFGRITETRAKSIGEIVSHVCQTHTTFEIKLGSVGVFPNLKSPRVLWVGLKGNLTPLFSLQNQIEDGLRRLGFSSEGRLFSPHLTLARIRTGTSDLDRQTAIKALFSTQLESGTKIFVSSVSLIRSVIMPDGLVHEPLFRMPLRSDSVGEF